MTAIAILIFLGETLLGTLLFVAIGGLIKFWAEHLEAAEEKPVVEKKPVAAQVVKAKV